MIRTVAIGLIIEHGETQTRAIDEELVAYYADLISRKVKLPAIDCTFDGKHYHVWDGYHRLRATRIARIDGRPVREMEVKVVPGGLDEAIWLSCTANTKHGLNRTTKEKQAALRKALASSKSEKMSNRELADHCGIHYSTVSRWRAELESDTEQHLEEEAGVALQHLNRPVSTDEEILAAVQALSIDTSAGGLSSTSNEPLMNALSDIQPIASADTQATPVEQPSVALPSPERRIGRDGKSYPAKVKRNNVVPLFPTPQEQARQSLAVLAEVLIDAPPEIQQAIKILVAYFTPAALTISQS